MNPRTQIQVDIAQYPTPQVMMQDLKPNTNISIGDLHGNVMKLIFILIQQKIMNLNPPPNTDPQKSTPEWLYYELANIYLTPVDNLTSKQLTRFKEILTAATFNPNAKSSLIRLIGDELADRGSNDYFMLLLFKKLADNNIPTESLYSNHSGEFFMACESVLQANTLAHESQQGDQFLHDLNPNDGPITRGIDNFPLMKGIEQPAFKTIHLGQGQGISLENLGVLIKKNLVSKEEVVELIKSYMPMVKPVTYEIEGNPNCAGGMRFIFGAHAPVGVKTIIGLAKHFNIAFDPALANALLPNDPDVPMLLQGMKTMEENLDSKETFPNLDPAVLKMAKIIDQINKKFESLKAETLKALTGENTQGGIYQQSRGGYHKAMNQREANKHYYEHPSIESLPFEYALTRVAWTRPAKDKELKRYDPRPNRLGKAEFFFMNGHDILAQEFKQFNVIDLDNGLGKLSTGPNCITTWKGALEVYQTHGKTLTQMLELDKTKEITVSEAKSPQKSPSLFTQHAVTKTEEHANLDNAAQKQKSINDTKPK